MVGSSLGNFIQWSKVQEDLLSDKKSIWIYFEADSSWHREKHSHRASYNCLRFCFPPIQSNLRYFQQPSTRIGHESDKTSWTNLILQTNFIHFIRRRIVEFYCMGGFELNSSELNSTIARRINRAYSVMLLSVSSLYQFSAPKNLPPFVWSADGFLVVDQIILKGKRAIWLKFDVFWRALKSKDCREPNYIWRDYKQKMKVTTETVTRFLAISILEFQQSK